EESARNHRPRTVFQPRALGGVFEWAGSSVRPTAARHTAALHTIHAGDPGRDSTIVAPRLGVDPELQFRTASCPVRRRPRGLPDDRWRYAVRHAVCRDRQRPDWG